MKRIAATVAAGTLAAGALVAAAPAASADVEDRGTCTGSSRWEASMDLEHGAFDIEFEVKAAQAGQRWRLTVKQNGTRVYSQTRRAVVEADDDSPRAEARWDVSRANHPNMRETFVLRATNLATGEVCRATLRE